MKTKLVFTFLLFLIFFLRLSATEPDTIWTNTEARNGVGKFSNDGSRIIVSGRWCLNSENGHLIWENLDAMDHNFFFTHNDSNIISCRGSQVYYYSIEDGSFVKSLDTIYRKNRLSYFNPSDSDSYGYKTGWQEPYIKSFIFADDDSIAFIVYKQDYIKETTPKASNSIAMICRYDLINDTILTSRPILIGNDSLLGDSFGAGGININNSNYFALNYQGINDSNFIWLYNKSTLELVSRFNYDEQKYGKLNNLTSSYLGDKLAFGTNKGYLLVLNIPDMSIIKDILLSTEIGYGLGSISFSRNDSMIVTNEGKKFNGNIIRRFNDTLKIYQYSKDYFGGYLDISPDNSKILLLGTIRTILMHARWNPTMVEKDNEPSPTILFPNPADKNIYIKNEGIAGNDGLIQIYDTNGILYKEIKPEYLDNDTIRFNTESLPQGTYFINITGKKNGKFSYKLIINR